MIRFTPARYGWMAVALLLVCFSWSSVQEHDSVPLDDWRQDLRADAAGYYIYLPGTFHYGMRANALSDTLLEHAGRGFRFDRGTDRIITKYTYGTAVLELPFYLFAEAVEGYGATMGWTRTHHRAMEVGAILYWVAGLLLIVTALQRWRPVRHSTMVLVFVLIAFGTNTFYYAHRVPGFSHIYSFFLVALALRAAVGVIGRPQGLPWRAVFLCANALVVLIRPIDLLAVVTLHAVLWVVPEKVDRVKELAFAQVVVLLLFSIPQLVYWRFAHGQWLYYSYGGESFSNWAAPKIAEVLIAPISGLLTHAPSFLLLPFALWAVAKENRKLAGVMALMFLVLTYSCAAWHAWNFGCSFGMRPFVEYTPFLAIGTWILFDRLRQRSIGRYRWIGGIALLLCLINYRMMRAYGICVPNEVWDWSFYRTEVLATFLGRTGY